MTVKIVLRNPLQHSDQIDYTIVPADNALAADWMVALKQLVQADNLLEKNFCFMGFPKTARTLEYLCDEANAAAAVINNFFDDYKIEEVLAPADCIGYDYNDNGPNQVVFNRLHLHFETLQGTVNQLSDYYYRADYETKYAIRQLNNTCHEMETLILSQRKLINNPYWTRPSQITTFLAAPRYDLKDQHRDGFATNGYDRVLGGVYMHWAQIGKTLFEVFRDEHAPVLTDAVCSAVTELKYYSGEFDVEWGNDVTYSGNRPWHAEEQDRFRQWLVDNGRDPMDPALSLGYLPIGQVALSESFGTTDYQTIWDMLGSHSDIYKIELNGVSSTFDYCWTDADYKQKQIDMMRPGYDYSSRKTL